MTSSSDARTVYIEFAGLPGVGKSAVSEAVVDRLTELGYRCGVQARMGGRVRTRDGVVEHSERSWRRHTRAERVAGYARLFTRMWPIAAPLLALAVRRPYDLRQALRRIRRLLLNISKADTATALVVAGESDLVVFDQGILPCFRELLAATRVKDSDALPRIVGPTLDLMADRRVVVIALETDVATIVSRIASRPREMGPYDRMDAESALGALGRQARYFEALIDYLGTTRLAPDLVRLDAAEPLETVVDRALAAILERLEPGPAATAGMADGRLGALGDGPAGDANAGRARGRPGAMPPLVANGDGGHGGTSRDRGEPGAAAGGRDDAGVARDAARPAERG